MIDWKAMKKAADIAEGMDGTPPPANTGYTEDVPESPQRKFVQPAFGGVVPGGRMPSRAPGGRLVARPFKVVDPRMYDQGFLKPKPDPGMTSIPKEHRDVYMDWMRSFLGNFGAAPVASQEGGASTEHFRLPLRNIRTAMYGDSPVQMAREQKETQSAMENRWADLFRVAGPMQAMRLNYLRRKGYMPPILPPGSNEIAWSDFVHPDQEVNITVSGRPERAYQISPGKIGSGMFTKAYPMGILLPLQNGMRATTRHELAHAVTEMSADKGNTIVPGIPGQDAGEAAYLRGREGSYEFDNPEFYRWMFLNKALAGSRGDPAFTTPEEFLDWYTKTHEETGLGSSMSLDPSKPSVEDGRLSRSETRSDSFLNTVALIRRGLRDPDPAVRKDSERKWNRLMIMLQHAIRVSDTGRRMNGVNV